MTLIEQIDQDVIKALKAKESAKLLVLRGLKSDLKYKKIDKGDELTEEETTAVLNSAAKKHKDSIEQFQKGGREDLVTKEKFGLEIIMSYLPEQIGEDELFQIVKDAVAESGATTPRDIGLIMKIVIPKVKGRADGKMINQLAMKLLT